MVRIDLPEHTSFWIEEAEVCTHIVGHKSRTIVLIARTIHFVVNITILQIGIRGEATPEVVVHAPINVHILLVGVIFIVRLFRIERTEIVAHPEHMPIVQAIIFVPASA